MKRRDTGRMGSVWQLPSSLLKETTMAYIAERGRTTFSTGRGSLPSWSFPRFSALCVTLIFVPTQPLDPWIICTAQHHPSNSRYRLLSIYNVPALCLSCSLLSYEEDVNSYSWGTNEKVRAVHPELKGFWEEGVGWGIDTNSWPIIAQL